MNNIGIASVDFLSGREKKPNGIRIGKGEIMMLVATRFSSGLIVDDLHGTGHRE